MRLMDVASADHFSDTAADEDAEIERLLAEATRDRRPPAVERPSGSAVLSGSAARSERLLAAIEAGLDAALTEPPQPRGHLVAETHLVSEATGARPFEFACLDQAPADRTHRPTIEPRDEVPLDLHIELGRTELSFDDVLELREGAVVPLDKRAADPVDLVIDGRLVARGEVLVLDGHFCVRVSEIVAAR